MATKEQKSQSPSQLLEAFASSKNTNEMLNLLKEMETHAAFDDQVLGYSYYRLSYHLHHKDRNHKKALTFANKALKNLDRDGGYSPLPYFPGLLQVLASIHISMKRFNDSLPFLIRARDMLLMGGEDEGSCVSSLLNVHRLLIQVYSIVFNFKEALVLCLETLEFLQKKKKKKLEGDDSEVLVACDRVAVGIVYKELGEYEKALEEIALARRVFEDSNLKSDLFIAEVEAADVMIALGRYDEAVATLKNVMHQAREIDDGPIFLLAPIAMAKAFCNQGNFADCKWYLEISREVIDRAEHIFPVRAADAYSRISAQYEIMNEFETAICLLKRALALLEKLPYEQHSMGKASAKIGSLLLLTGKVEEAVTYLESAAKSLNYSLGPKHIQVGYNYNNLGAAYSKLGRPQPAAQMFAVAKDIMDVCLAPDHVDTIEACQNLAKAYGEMGSYSIAIDFQQQVINAWESHGAGGEDKLREAHQLLEEIKKKASGFYANESPEKTLP